MPTAIINKPDVRVHLRGDRLEVHGRNETTERDELLREIPLRDLDRIIIGESGHITQPALAAVLREGIPVQVFSWNGRFLGGFLPAQNQHGLVRLRQYQRTLDPAFALILAARIVTAKLYNQRRVLQRVGASRKPGPPPPTDGALEGTFPSNEPRDTPTPNASHNSSLASDLAAALKWLDSIFGSIRSSQSLDELRGYEGASTARYFQAWASFLPKDFPFERRSTRPPLNPVNACISFASTMLYNEAVAFAHGHGLDPALGLLHTTENGRWSLALDLIEPFRPVLAEALTLDLFSHQILNAAHFEEQNQGVYLNEEGRKKFFLQYERRMERQFMSECAGHRTSLRQELENQAAMFKASLEDQTRFEPFLMN